MSGVRIDREAKTAPNDGYLTVEIEGVEHAYAVDEGDEIVFEWEDA
jgi:hypothetical protein